MSFQGAEPRDLEPIHFELKRKMNVYQCHVAIWAYLLLVTFLIAVPAFALGKTSGVREIGLALDYKNECLAPLLEADADNDLVLSNEEYMTFVQLYSSDPMFQVQSYADFPLPLILEYTQWTCIGYCSSFPPNTTGVDISNCLNDCQDGIPLTPPENFGPLDLKPYLYNVCASTFKEVKSILNITDDETDDRPSAPDKEEVPIRFGMANLRNLNASDIAQNKDGSLNQVLLPSLKRLFNLVKENLYVETLGGRLRRTLQTRFLQLNAEDVWVKTIDNRGKY